MARMASQSLQEAFIDNGTKDEYLLPDELLDHLLDTLRSLILHSDDPRKDRLLNLYVYCMQKSDRACNGNFYCSPEWRDIRTAVRNFLIHLTDFDLEAWEQKQLINAGGTDSRSN